MTAQERKNLLGVTAAAHKDVLAKVTTRWDVWNILYWHFEYVFFLLAFRFRI